MKEQAYTISLMPSLWPRIFPKSWKSMYGISIFATWAEVWSHNLHKLANHASDIKYLDKIHDMVTRVP